MLGLLTNGHREERGAVDLEEVVVLHDGTDEAGIDMEVEGDDAVVGGEGRSLGKHLQKHVVDAVARWAVLHAEAEQSCVVAGVAIV